MDFCAIFGGCVMGFLILFFFFFLVYFACGRLSRQPWETHTACPAILNSLWLGQQGGAIVLAGIGIPDSQTEYPSYDPALTPLYPQMCPALGWLPHQVQSHCVCFLTEFLSLDGVSATAPGTHRAVSTGSSSSVEKAHHQQEGHFWKPP